MSKASIRSERIAAAVEEKRNVQLDQWYGASKHWGLLAEASEAACLVCTTGRGKNHLQAAFCCSLSKLEPGSVAATGETGSFRSSPGKSRHTLEKKKKTRTAMDSECCLMEWSLNIIWCDLDGPDLTITFLYGIFHPDYEELFHSPWWQLRSFSAT